jgi:hypothetical protein
MTDGGLPPPNWYPDPDDANSWRWWSGSSWTTHTAQRESTFSAKQLSEEASIQKFAAWAPIVYALGAIMIVVIDVSTSGQLSRWLHAMRLLFSNHVQNSVFPSAPIGIIWGDLLSLPLVAAEIILMIWQYRAAIVARTLGYPMRYSPGWGVASWLVPIVQLWMPYIAVRDLLPEHHPVRRKLPLWWATLLIGASSSIAIPFALAEARPLGIALLVIAFMTYGTVAILGRAIVVATWESHKTAVEAK